MCVTGVTQAWKVFVNNFQVLNFGFFNQQKISVTERVSQSYVTLIRFMIAVHCFHIQNRTLSSFLEWSVLMDECRPRREV